MLTQSTQPERGSDISQATARRTGTVVPSNYYLYAEDDPDDQFFMKEMMAAHHPEIGLVVCDNGFELFQYLEALRPGDHYPCMIILDLNMPVWDGHRTLRELRNKPFLNELTVVMFSTSSAKPEAAHAIELGADAFITKPVKFEDFAAVINTFTELCKPALKKG